MELTEVILIVILVVVSYGIIMQLIVPISKSKHLKDQVFDDQEQAKRYAERLQEIEKMYVEKCDHIYHRLEECKKRNDHIKRSYHDAYSNYFYHKLEKIEKEDKIMISVFFFQNFSHFLSELFNVFVFLNFN